jgi:hypothetical protein
MRKLFAASLLLTVFACGPVHIPNPQPTPIPTPVPTPEPTPTPTPEPVCQPNPPALDRFGLKIHVIGPNWVTLDSTPQVKDREFCAAIGWFDGRSVCALGLEGDPCRSVRERIAVGGDPIWTGPGEVSPEGPYLYRVRRGVAGTVTVCSASGVCGSLTLTGKE